MKFLAEKKCSSCEGGEKLVYESPVGFQIDEFLCRKCFAIRYPHRIVNGNLVPEDSWRDTYDVHLKRAREQRIHYENIKNDGKCNMPCCFIG